MRKYLVVKVLRQMSHCHCFCDDVLSGGGGDGAVAGEGDGGGAVVGEGDEGATVKVPSATWPQLALGA